jgi:hypothetical protein
MTLNDIKKQTQYIIQDHTDDLMHQMEILKHHTEDAVIDDVFTEIFNDFHSQNIHSACLKLNMIIKLILRNFSDFKKKIKVMNKEDYESILDLSLALMNAIAINESLSLQNLIMTENNIE